MSSSTDTAEETMQIDLSPCKKRSKRSHFDVKTKQMILNVYEQESEDNPTLPVDEVVRKVAYNTGVCNRSVYRIVKEYKTKHKFSVPKTNQNRKQIIGLVDDFDKNEIRRKIHQYFCTNELPTIDKVLNDVNGDPNLPNFKRTTFYKLLKSLNFYYKKLGRTRVLIERDEIMVWRRKYLKKVMAYRNESRKIYYLGEIWVNAGHTKSKIRVNKFVSKSKQAFQDGFSKGFKNPSGKGKRLIIYHIGSTDGFVPGGLWSFELKTSADCHEEMDGDSFENWFANILPHLEENSVIVLDNAPNHSRKLETIPTSATRKSEIEEWLQSKNIHFEEDLLKVELLSIVNQHKKIYNKYRINEMAEAENKIVLRLPPYHAELNPIELIWADVKNFVVENNKAFKYANIKNIFNDAIDTITAEKWRKCVQHVKEKVEKQMWELDNIAEMQVAPVLINAESESSASSDEDD